MAKKSKSTSTSTPNASAEVKRFLSKIGKKGGQTTKRLIEAGKEALGE